LPDESFVTPAATRQGPYELRNYGSHVAWNEGQARGDLNSVDALMAAATEAGTKRVRPLLVTVMTNILGLLPILVDDGVGADVAKRIAAPMGGGLVSLTLLTLLVIPAVYVVWRGFSLRNGSVILPERAAPAAEPSSA
jgi:Cu(I)/Ag(I) efflux system membrane protein CusA/SilA